MYGFDVSRHFGTKPRIDKNKWHLIDNIGQEQILNLIRR